MNGKFTTTSSSLYNNKNEQSIPDWMENLSNNIELKEKQVLDLGIKSKGVFAEKQTVYRDETDGTPRYLEATFNDTKLITDAKISLAKFLSGRYYKVEGKVKGQTVDLDVKIDGIPARFTFGFMATDGKLNSNDTFSIEFNGEYGEYPFSKAGFEECVSDIKSNKAKLGSKKVEAVGKGYIINREEIYRRYNGHLREATDKINELINDGSLMGVGSNAYASIYDMDYLFPQIEKEAGEAPLPAFEFAPNTEHVAANQYKSAQVLTIEADKLLSEFFSDYKVIDSTRDNNELLVKANVMHNGIIYNVDMGFGVENEKLASLKIVEMNDQRMTLEEFLNNIKSNSKLVDSYLSKNASAKYIYRGNVLERRTIASKLHGLVKASLIDDIIENWTDRKLITQINSTTFCTNHSFEQLLASINTKLLTAEEQDEIREYSKKFGSGIEFDRQNVQDTGIREYDNIETSDELRLANLKNELSKNFKNFKLANFKCGAHNVSYDTNIHATVYDEYLADLLFIHPNTGAQNKLNIKVGFYGSKAEVIVAEIKDKYYPVVVAAGMFGKSPVLAAYLQDNKANIVEGSIIINERTLKTKLASYVDMEKIDSIIDDWYAKKYIVNTGNGTYVSNYRLEELLDKSGIEILSEEDRKQIATAKAYFGKSFEREAVEDTGIRQPEEYVTNETLLNKANEFIAQHFNSFKPQGFSVKGENVNYNIALFDDGTGLMTNINLIMGFDGNKITACHAMINNEKVELKNIKKAFASNDTLNKYLEMNPGKRINAPMMMTTTGLIKKLSTISNITLEEVNDTINEWENKKLVSKIASNVFASKYTLEQLIASSNIESLSDELIKNRLEASIRNNLVVTSSYIKDSDTREMIATYSPERMVLHAKTELNKIFKSYDILDANVDNDAYTITARVVNPWKGIRQKLKFTFAISNNKPGNIISVSNNNKTVGINDIQSLSNNSEALDIFIQHHAATDRNGKYVITKIQLNNLLGAVTDKSTIDNICDALMSYEILKPITSEAFASDYSASEIVENLNKLGLTNIEVGKEQNEMSKRDENTIVIDDNRIMDNDTRIVEINKSLSPQMQKLSQKMKLTAENAHKQKMITSNKLNQISMMLDEAKNEKDLENIWKELKKYFK